MGNSSKLDAELGAKIKTKKEILTPTRALESDYGTRSRTRSTERHSIVPTHPPPQCQSSTAKHRVTKDTPFKETPQTKWSKLNDPFVGCCTCDLTSTFSDARYSCHKASLECAHWRSYCCGNSNNNDPSSCSLIAHQERAAPTSAMITGLNNMIELATESNACQHESLHMDDDSSLDKNNS